MYEYKSLLDQVNAITTRYKKINELTGENFNVFFEYLNWNLPK
jgi:hypothetical protein